VSIFIP